MLRTRLLTATAAVALFGAGSALAQTAPETMTPPAGQTAPSATAPATSSAPTDATQAATPAAGNTVVDVLRAQGQFTTLLSALEAAQLTETLTTQPAISIFAPTDAAFAALPEAERTRLLDPANANELRQLLLYHMVVADVNSSQIEGARGGVETAASTQVQLDGTGDAIKVDNATVTQADIDASNGAIFVIDQVLNPAQSQVAAGDGADATAAPAGEAMDEAMPATPPAGDGMTDDTVDDGSTGTDAANPAPVESSGNTWTSPATGATAPNGQPASSTTTTASPPVANPTDGQQDGGTETETPPTAPPPQS